MRMIAWGILIGSLFGLLLLLRKKSPVFGWIGKAALHVVVAAVVLYLLNGFVADYGFYFPINAFTVATVSLLGLPGIGLIAALQWTLLP